MIGVPDLRAECKGLEAQVAQLLRVVAGPVADPAAVALLRLSMARTPGAPFDRHAAEWPIARVAREWECFRAETRALLASRPDGIAIVESRRRAA